jgi:hypothetical protein
MVSNPYPSAVDFNVLYNHALNNPSGSPVIQDHYYIWIHGAAGGYPTGNYGIWDISSGSVLGVTKDIQVGQAVFVETLQSAPFWFMNTARLHSTGAFYKESYANRLVVTGTGNDFGDQLIVHFIDGASPEYAINEDAEKWSSAFEEATQIWTVSSDQANLTINGLPPLGSGMVSVPMNFKCGADAEYTLSFDDIESFEYGTEIWLEDLQTGSEWINLNNLPVYTFTASANDPQGRFILHFFGPTGIGEQSNSSNIRIYSFDQNAYIVNLGNETIEEYVVYDMMGRELQHGTLPASSINKVFIGQVSSYYIVKVVTNERIYSGKVFINR